MRGGNKNRQKTQGFSTLVFTLVILLSIAMLATVSSQAVFTHQKTLTNYHQGQSAFDAAQGGLDYAVPYLTVNYDTLTDGASFGQTLSDGTSFLTQIEYLDGKDLLRVTSVGYSSDGLDSKTLQKIIQYKGPETVIQWPYAVQARKNLMIRDNGELSDTGGNIYTVKFGTETEIVDSGRTVLATGVSSTAGVARPTETSGSIAADIVHDPVLATQTDEQFENQFLGQRIADFQAVTTEVTMPANAGTLEGTYIYDYSDSTFAPYSSAESITFSQVDGEVQIKNGVVIGSPEHPKSVVVNLSGNYTLPDGTVKPSEFQLRENAEVYGNLVVNGNMTIVDATKVHGNIVVEGNLTLVDGAKIDGSVIVKGDVLLLNDSKIDGAVFALGNVHVHESAQISGAVVAGNEVRLSGNGKIAYDTDMARVIATHSTATPGYGQLAGSWADF